MSMMGLWPAMLLCCLCYADDDVPCQLNSLCVASDNIEQSAVKRTSHDMQSINYGYQINLCDNVNQQ
jgi:hypothetical protein